MPELGPPRGFTLRHLLFTLIFAGVAYWAFAFAPAYIDNIDIRGQVTKAAVLCYRIKDDDLVRKSFFMDLGRKYAGPGTAEGEEGGKPRIEFEPDDFRIDRTDQPPAAEVYFSYARHVKLPFSNGDRLVRFTIHRHEDLTEVKW